MSTDIDKSLDQIIKDQKKAKRKEIAQKKNKQLPGKAKGQAGKITGRPANAGKKRQGGLARGGQAVRQKGQGQGNRPAAANQQRKQKFVANRLKNRQALTNVGKQMLNKAKKAQNNSRLQNNQAQQTRRKDARQNIINKRRGMEAGFQQAAPQRTMQNRRGRNNNRQGNVKNNGDLTVSFKAGPARQQQNRQRQRRRPQNSRGSNLNELRISIADNSNDYGSKKQSNLNKRFDFDLGKTQTSLNDRFATRKIRF